jgi:hypothetical protein
MRRAGNTGNGLFMADIVRGYIVDFLQLSVAPNLVFAPFIGSMTEATGSKDREFASRTPKPAGLPWPVALKLASA